MRKIEEIRERYTKEDKITETFGITKETLTDYANDVGDKLKPHITEQSSDPKVADAMLTEILGVNPTAQQLLKMMMLVRILLTMGSIGATAQTAGREPMRTPQEAFGS